MHFSAKQGTGLIKIFFFSIILAKKRMGLVLNNCSEKKVKYFIIICVLSQCTFIMVFYKKNQY